jgi:hypothetical protein
MNRRIAIILVLLTLSFASARADDPAEDEAAQLSGMCGEIKNRNVSWQFGTGLWIEYIAETSRPVNTFECPWLTVSVEAYVVGVPGSAHSDTGTFVATSRRQIPVSYAGEWQTNSNHYRNYFWLFSFNSGTASSVATVEERQEEGGPSEGYGGACGDPESPCEAASSNGGDSASPIIIDVEGKGYRLTDANDGVFFDIDADGLLDAVAWTHPFSENAFLAIDRNGNGRIDDGSELFGNHTPAYALRSSATASNGFEALRFLENPSYGQSQRNEMLDGRDAAFERLLLWTDRNHNGLSEPDELQSLDSAGVVGLHTDYKESRKRDRYGNEFRQRAKVIWRDGEAYAYDVWLKRRP